MIEFAKIDRDTINNWNQDENAWEDEFTREQITNFYQADIKRAESYLQRARELGEYTREERLRFMREELSRLQDNRSPLLRIMPLSDSVSNALQRFGVRTISGVQIVIESGRKPGGIGVKHWQEITEAFDKYSRSQRTS